MIVSRTGQNIVREINGIFADVWIDIYLKRHLILVTSLKATYSKKNKDTLESVKRFAMKTTNTSLIMPLFTRMGLLISLYVNKCICGVKSVNSS